MNCLNFHTKHKLTELELGIHGIDKESGTSSSSSYKDSVFSVIEIAGIHKYYVVYRIPTEEIDIPLNESVTKPYEVVSAMLIKPNGFSVRPEFRGYRFTWEPSPDYKYYTIVKQLADSNTPSYN